MDTRSQMHGKARALATATHVSESCLGLALLKNHDNEDRTHMEKLRGLEKENRNIQNELEHQRKQFLKRRLGTPGPMIILEHTRDPDPFSSNGDGIIRRGIRPRPRGSRETVDVREADERSGSLAGYMMPTMSRGTVTCSTSTLGAFRISTQRPLDRWNPAALQKVYFKSAVLPSWPLTESDLGALRTSLSRHCWIRKFRDPGQLASAENGNRRKRSKRCKQRGTGRVKGPSDEQVERNGRGKDRGEELIRPTVDSGNQLSYSRRFNVSSRSLDQTTDLDSSRQMNYQSIPSKSIEVAQRHQSLPALTERHHYSVIKRKTKPQSKNTLYKVQPSLGNEEPFFKTAIEYSITADVGDPDYHGDPNNVISSESRDRKTASVSDALPEMTSTRNLLKSLRAVSFSDDVIEIKCR